MTDLDEIAFWELVDRHGLADCSSDAHMALRELCEQLEGAKLALRLLEPYLDGLVCYASTMGEHEPNRIAVGVRAILANGRWNKWGRKRESDNAK